MHRFHDQPSALDRRQNNQRPVEEREHQERTNETSQDESDDAMRSGIRNPGRGDRESDSTPSDKSCHGNRQPLQQQREQRTERAETKRDDKREPRGRLVNYQGSKVNPGRESERRHEKPEEPAAAQEQGYPYDPVKN